MTTDVAPAHVERVLNGLQGVRPTRDGWDALCPCPEHNEDGDQHASLRITIGDDGRVLIKCRVGCPTDAVLGAIGLEWEDLFESSSPEDGSQDQHAEVAVEEPIKLEKADAEVVHRAYTSLLTALSLSDDHRRDLRRRGLTDAEIDHRGYRSLRNFDRSHAAKVVQRGLGDVILGVPGFVQGGFGLTLAGLAAGLVVPVRDLQGRIAALKIRSSSEPKYTYLTSGAAGPSPGSPVHVPLGVTAPAPTVRLTEGELKSDVCVALDSMPTIGLPGVTQWRPALPVLRELGTKTVMLAFDADAKTKVPVFEQLEALYEELIHQGFTVEMEVWDD